MLLSLQGGVEMSCSTAKDDHLRVKQGPPLEATVICRQPRSRLMSRGVLMKMSYSYSGDDAASFVQLLSARGQI